MAPTTDQILEIARKAIKIFGKYGLECCLMGSVASYLYGVDRAPNVSSPLCRSITMPLMLCRLSRT